MYQAAAHNHKARLNQYLVKEIMDATPQQLIIKLYDFAIVNCQRQNLVKTNAAYRNLSMLLGLRVKKLPMLQPVY